MSKIVTYSEVRDNLKAYLDYVTENHDPVFITRKNGEEVVMIAKSDYEAMDETAYLLSTEANKKALLDTIDKINRGDNTDCVTFNSTEEMRKYFKNLPDEECEG